MPILSLWKDLSIRKKIWGLVLLPTIFILALSNRQASEVNNQLANLEKARHMVNALSLFNNLEHGYVPTTSHASFANKQEKTIAVLNAKITTIFPAHDILKFQQLTNEYQETIAAIHNAENIESQYDNIQWQKDVYEQLLFAIEKTPFDSSMPIIDSHLKALFQLEWLVFWAQEENWQSKLFIDTYQENPDIALIMRDDIRTLIQRQQLFVERFISMNANEKQVELLLTAFSNIAFQASSEYREQLLDETIRSQLTQTEIEAGNNAFSQRLSLLQGVANAIQLQLKQEIQKAINAFKRYRIIFFSITAISLVIILTLGIALAHRIISNLQTVLNFLSNKKTDNHSLTSQIEGRDELSLFAKEVERLTFERRKNQQELLLTKNEAISAKEEAIQASKAKSSFLANMSHEIRTPLNGVIGISEILASTQLSATQKDYVDTIETSSQLLLGLINDILDFSKIESGKLPVSTYSTDLRESIYDVAAIVAPKIKEKGVSLRVNIDERIPFSVMADDHRLRQVLMNLMSNAAKFTNTGTISIGVTCAEHQNNTAFLFDVIDEGIGIDEAQQKKIFEPFAQEDNSTTRQFGGTGLGLAISTQLIELMGGKLNLLSEKNRGSHFFFTLPLVVTDPSNQHYHLPQHTKVTVVCDTEHIIASLTQELHFFGIEHFTVKKQLSDINTHTCTESHIIIYYLNNNLLDNTQMPQLAKFNQGNHALCIVQALDTKRVDFGKNITALVTYPLLGNRLNKALERCYNMTLSAHDVAKNNINNGALTKILLVEDNKINQKVALLHMSKAGFEYNIANNGEEAIDMYTTADYDVVLMDCMMPIKDGFTAAKEIRNYEAQYNKKRTPIIALTASIVEDDIKKCFESGMDDYIPKPFKAEMFENTILRALSNQNRNIPLPSSPIINTPTPANEKTTDEEDINQTPLTEHNTPAPSIRILLVEDNRINQKVALLLFKKAGYQYVVANDGQEAFDIYSKDHHFDIILMDLMMPVKDGFEASKDIRAYEKKQKLSTTPIIAVTASVVNDDIKQCFEAGMNAYIPKPIKAEKLYNEIENLITL